MKKEVLIILVIITYFTSCTTDLRESVVSYIKVACIGDSITHGGYNKEIGTDYPKILNDLLGEEFETVNYGVSGATLIDHEFNSYIRSDEYYRALKYSPDIVIIKLGTNDSKPSIWKYKDQFISDYIKLINRFKQLNSKPNIWLCYPIPAYSDDWGISNEIIVDEIIPLIDTVSENSGVGIVDLHSVHNELSYYYHDDLIHPNKKGCRIIAKTLYNKILK